MKRLTLAAVAGAIGTAGLIALGQTSSVVAQEDDAALLAAFMEEGADLFDDNCAACHGAEGEGTVGPRLAGNPLLASAGSVAAQILSGNPDRGMPAFDNLSDREVAAIATYVRNSWGHDYGLVRESTVANRR